LFSADIVTEKVPMPRSRPISLNVITDEATNIANVVLQAYPAANGKSAFEAAVQAWLELHPKATSNDGATAVANIICHHM
jgi:hypothetical protein